MRKLKINKVGGTVGVGEFSSATHPLLYNIWYRMLERIKCWGDNVRNKSYEGCSVQPEWYNFQNFAKWYCEQRGHDLGWHLEKDLLFKGNKVYSEDTCILVPLEVNMFLTKRKSCRAGLIGSHYRVKTGRFLSAFTRDKVHTHIGSYATEMEAHLAYKHEKEKYAKVLAERYKEQLDIRAYNALINYVVEITD